MIALQIKDLSKSFGSTEVLKKINLDIEEGSFLVLLGPSGCGKSTLLNIIAGLETIDEGAVLIDDYDVSNVEPKDRNIAMVFQSYALYPHMTVYENLAFPLRVRKIPKDEADKKIDKALSMVSLQGFESRMPMQLSGGQQQRVAIARALAMDPIAMLFDEPTSALDPEMINEVLDVMVELAKDGMTMMVVTHEMGFARRVANRIVFMDEGRIEEDCSTDEFFDSQRGVRAQAFLSKILHH